MTSIALIVLILLSAFSLFIFGTSDAAVIGPSKLVLFTGSPAVLADNSTYRCVFIQLQDASGKIARATKDITIGLSSSLISIGTVDSSITIPHGETFGSAQFTSTFNPGTTTISASSTGFETVISSITTVGPIPSSIGVYGFPSTLPSDGNSYAAIMVQLQDSTGSPTRAPKGGIQVSLSSSDTTIGTVTPTVTIFEGQTYAIATFTTTTKAETEAKIQTVLVTAVTQGYAPNQVTITTTPVASSASKLKIFAGPPKVLADNTGYRHIAVQLQNASGYVVKKQSGDVMVNIASTDPSVFGISSLSIPAGQSYALATLTSTYKVGAANITAVANDFPLTTQLMNTFGFIPSKIVVYDVPSNLPSDGRTYQTIQVQLQDSLGRPAKSMEADVNVKLYSSKPEISVVSSIVTIPVGRSTATGSSTTTYSPGSTALTAQASGYTTGQVTLTTSLIDYCSITASAGANGTISPSGNITTILGGSQRFTITANNGYHVEDLLVDSVSQGATSTYDLSNITTSHTMFVEFGINRFDITVTQGQNGVITPGTSTFDFGDSPTFTITPNDGYYISTITANGVRVPVTSSSGQTYRFNPLAANGSITATYAVTSVPIKVIQTENGTIAPGTTSVDYDGSQNFTITPKAGFHIADVLVNGSAVGPVSSLTLDNIKGTTTVSAVFDLDKPTPATSATPIPSPTPSPTMKTTIQATTETGGKIDLPITGNITSSQINNVFIRRNQSTTCFYVYFTVTGESSTIGLGNVTIPKSTVGSDVIPLVYVDDEPASIQGFKQDSNNYYVWYYTHFSTHDITISFIPDLTSAVFSQQGPKQNVVFAAAIIAPLIACVSIYLVLNRRKQPKFGLP